MHGDEMIAHLLAVGRLRVDACVEADMDCWER